MRERDAGRRAVLQPLAQPRNASALVGNTGAFIAKMLRFAHLG
jgi:hypothetical protein